MRVLPREAWLDPCRRRRRLGVLLLIFSSFYFPLFISRPSRFRGGSSGFDLGHLIFLVVFGFFAIRIFRAWGKVRCLLLQVSVSFLVIFTCKRHRTPSSRLSILGSHDVCVFLKSRSVLVPLSEIKSWTEVYQRVMAGIPRVCLFVIFFSYPFLLLTCIGDELWNSRMVPPTRCRGLRLLEELGTPPPRIRDFPTYNTACAACLLLQSARLPTQASSNFGSLSSAA